MSPMLWDAAVSCWNGQVTCLWHLFRTTRTTLCWPVASALLKKPVAVTNADGAFVCGNEGVARKRRALTSGEVSMVWHAASTTARSSRGRQPTVFATSPMAGRKLRGRGEAEDVLTCFSKSDLNRDVMHAFKQLCVFMVCPVKVNVHRWGVHRRVRNSANPGLGGTIAADHDLEGRSGVGSGLERDSGFDGQLLKAACLIDPLPMGVPDKLVGKRRVRLLSGMNLSLCDHTLQCFLVGAIRF